MNSFDINGLPLDRTQDVSEFRPIDVRYVSMNKSNSYFR